MPQSKQTAKNHLMDKIKVFKSSPDYNDNTPKHKTKFVFADRKGYQRIFVETVIPGAFDLLETEYR